MWCALQRFQHPEETILHTSWTGDVTIGNDVALLRLYKKSVHTPITILPKHQHLQVGEPLLLAGWGIQEHDGSLGHITRTTNLNLIDNKLCSSKNVWGNIIKDSMLCTFALGHKSCKGKVLQTTLLVLLSPYNQTFNLAHLCNPNESQMSFRGRMFIDYLLVHQHKFSTHQKVKFWMFYTNEWMPM